MSQELILKWWPWGKRKADHRSHKQAEIDETLRHISSLRTKVEDDLQRLQAMVNGEDLWFKCSPIPKNHTEKGRDVA